MVPLGELWQENLTIVEAVGSYPLLEESSVVFGKRESSLLGKLSVFQGKYGSNWDKNGVS